MKKTLVWLLVLVTVLGLAACSKKSNSATPGDISAPSPTPFELHISEDGEDVSGEYSQRLCSYPWLDTYDMEYYVLSEDGSYLHYRDEQLTEEAGSGSWKLLRDDEGYLSLHLDAAEGDDIRMYELELYDQSIYAFGADEFVFIWLLCDDAE